MVRKVKTRILVRSKCAPWAAWLLLGVASIPLALAWAEPSVWDGVYSAAQAKRGQELYAKACGSCHRDNLEGHGTTPSLAGAEFRDRWDGQTLDDLFEKMQVSMPADHPGSLSREQNAAILAFILRSNEMPSGEKDLQTNSVWLAKIQFIAAKPK